jgi:hypothetical protein
MKHNKYVTNHLGKYFPRSLPLLYKEHIFFVSFSFGLVANDMPLIAGYGKEVALKAAATRNDDDG